MRALLSITAILASTPLMALAAPAHGMADHARRWPIFSTYCANAPRVAVGSFLDPKFVVPITDYGKLPQLGLTVYWCAPSSRTYITLRYWGVVLPVSWNAVQDCLKGAFDRTQAQINSGGDRPILGGFFFWGDDPDTNGVYIHTGNVDNHQQTWGVLGSSISALQDFVRTLNAVGIIPRNLGFSIKDGDNRVASGDLASTRVNFYSDWYHY